MKKLHKQRKLIKLPHATKKNVWKWSTKKSSIDLPNIVTTKIKLNLRFR